MLRAQVTLGLLKRTMWSRRVGGQLWQKLVVEGDIRLAQDVERFVERMGPVHTDQELALRELRVRVRNEKRQELVR